MKPALARVSHIAIDFIQDKTETKTLEDVILLNQIYFNPTENPDVINFLQHHIGVYSTESFEKTSGFHLIRGMTYRINAR